MFAHLPSGQRKPAGHDHLVGPDDGCSQRVQLQEVPGVCGAVVVANIDLEFLGPLDATEFGGKGQAALPDVIISAFSTMALPASLDAGAQVLSLAVVEVVAEILVVRRG